MELAILEHQRQFECLPRDYGRKVSDAPDSFECPYHYNCTRPGAFGLLAQAITTSSAMLTAEAWRWVRSADCPIATSLAKRRIVRAL
jgi:hypothetical protein